MKILLPTDFSANANKALDYAIGIASELKAEVMILHANQDLNSLSAFPMDPTNFPYIIDGKVITDQLAQLQAKSLDSNISISTHVYSGDVLSCIIKATEDLKPEMIIMGTLGNSGILENLFGSVTASVIGRVEIPVLVIPLMAEWTKPERILFAINDFTEEPATIDVLLNLADTFSAKINMAVFINENKDVASDYIDKARGIAFYKQRLSSLPDHTNHIHIYGSGLQESLENYISENNIDLLAMVTHKRKNLFERIFLKSITKKISYHTNIPLLVLHSAHQ